LLQENRELAAFDHLITSMLNFSHHIKLLRVTENWNMMASGITLEHIAIHLVGSQDGMYERNRSWLKVRTSDKLVNRWEYSLERR
jgi:hypothetical protein